MDNKEIHSLLQKVHAEMEQARNADLDDDGRQLLRNLGRDINELLSRTEGVPLAPRASLVTALTQAVEHFEVTHPSLTAALSDLLTALDNAGI